MSFELNDYIERNYQKFLDYAKFHADRNNLTGMGEDLLQFVLEIILVDMDRKKVLSLLLKKYGNYNELHTYILGAIKINAFSPRSDFRRKVVNKLPIDRNSNIKRLNIECEIFDPDEIDPETKTLIRFNRIRTELELLDISDTAKDVFRWKFILGNNISEWPGPEPKSKLYAMYNHVVDAIRDRVNSKNQLQLS